MDHKTHNETHCKSFFNRDSVRKKRVVHRPVLKQHGERKWIGHVYFLKAVYRGSQSYITHRLCGHAAYRVCI